MSLLYKGCIQGLLILVLIKNNNNRIFILKLIQNLVLVRNFKSFFVINETGYSIGKTTNKYLLAQRKMLNGTGNIV